MGDLIGFGDCGQGADRLVQLLGRGETHVSPHIAEVGSEQPVEFLFEVGLEVVPEAVKVIKAAAAKTGLPIEWTELFIGKAGHEKYGNTLPPITEQTLRTLDGWFMGPIGHNAYPRGDMTWVMPPIRKKFDLFAALRPSLSHPNLPS